MCLVYQVQWWMEPLASFPALMKLSKLKSKSKPLWGSGLDAVPLDKVLITHDRLHLMTWTSQLWCSVDIYVSDVHMSTSGPNSCPWDLKMCLTYMVLCVVWWNSRQKLRHAELHGCVWFLLHLHLYLLHSKMILFLLVAVMFSRYLNSNSKSMIVTSYLTSLSISFLNCARVSVLCLGIKSDYICFGGGNSNPLQYACTGNPMDRGALWATVRGVTKSWAQLSD